MRDPLDARIGEVLQRVTLPVEPGKMREFARAIGDASPLYSAASAIDRGDASSAPPTFTTTAYLHTDEPFSHVPDRLGLDVARLVHGEQEWIYHRPPASGDVLTGETRLASVSSRVTRAGGAMRVVTVETEWVHADGMPAITERMTMLELPARDGTGANDPDYHKPA